MYRHAGRGAALTALLILVKLTKKVSAADNTTAAHERNRLL